MTKYTYPVIKDDLRITVSYNIVDVLWVEQNEILKDMNNKLIIFIDQ